MQQHNELVLLITLTINQPGPLQVPLPCPPLFFKTLRFSAHSNARACKFSYHLHEMWRLPAQMRNYASCNQACPEPLTRAFSRSKYTHCSSTLSTAQATWLNTLSTRLLLSVMYLHIRLMIIIMYAPVSEKAYTIPTTDHSARRSSKTNRI